MSNKKTTKISRNLNNLFLDPNNYRFVDNYNYEKVPQDRILDHKIQNRTRNFIEGKKREGIKDLISSFKTNGFLDVDMIQVRDLSENKYLVLEGNRRVAALKILQEDYDKGISIGNLDPQVFKIVPFIIHDNESDEKHLIIMGLKHISGNKKWSAINQSQLIYDYLKSYWQDDSYPSKERELKDSLGISLLKLRQSQRAYHLILEYKKSDYGDQFETDMFSLFVEMTKRTKIKEWLSWNDSIYVPENKINQERLFTWLSKIENEDVNNDDYIENDAIITKAHEIRDLVQFIDNNNALNIMEKTGSVAQGLVASGVIDKQEYETSITLLKENIKKINRFKDLISPEDLEELKETKLSFNAIFPSKGSLDINSGNIAYNFEYGDVAHFDFIHVNKYKNLNNFKIDRLNRINIIAGYNNAGKTSLLEAIFLLTKRNDIASFFELTKLKNKFISLNPVWLNRVFNEDICISGRFNNITNVISITKFEDPNIDKKDDYQASYKIHSELDSNNLESVIHTYEHEPIKREYEKIEHLCKSIFKSPYFYNSNEISVTYEHSVANKRNGKTAMDIIIPFIQKIDKDINSIKLVDSDDLKRFIVDSKLFATKNLDITSYGEGLQRVFEIALAFSYCSNGIICIDEFETAIHKTLLVDFTRFIQELAVTFNVQVFLTSHSKECIDAFVLNEYRNSDISAYLLTTKENVITSKFIKGERLDYLVDSIGLDIRGDNNE